MVERRVVWRRKRENDWHHVVECAVSAGGQSPAADFLGELAAGTWATDPEHAPPRDSEQIHDSAMLLATIEWVGRYGQPPRLKAVNHLRDGIWEFKQAARRLTYWDTPGDGTYTPKPRVEDVRDRTTEVPGPDEVPGGGYWWYPDLDEVLRLGCAWPKQGEKAPQDKIDEAERLREEDCAHDRT